MNNDVSCKIINDKFTLMKKKKKNGMGASFLLKGKYEKVIIHGTDVSSACVSESEHNTHIYCFLHITK